jgi:hypothetical protein
MKKYVGLFAAHFPQGCRYPLGISIVKIDVGQRLTA